MQSLNSRNINCHHQIGSFLATAFVLATISTATFAADRVIEESLVYKDPTVSRQNQMVKGISLDYYSFSQNVSFANAPNPDITGTIAYQQPGISGFVGYGDITLMVSYRSGTGTADFSAQFTGLGTLTLNESFTQSEYEFDLRWLMTNFQTTYFTPYALIGYAGTKFNSTITTPSLPSYSQSSEATDTVPLLGIGGIIPISDKFGFRVDEKFGFVSDTYSDSAGSVSSSYNISRLTATMYYNFADSWNGQLGARYESNNTGTPSTTGFYGMLGYTFR